MYCVIRYTLLLLYITYIFVTSLFLFSGIFVIAEWERFLFVNIELIWVQRGLRFENKTNISFSDYSNTIVYNIIDVL